jgi:hypothetical protein
MIVVVMIIAVVIIVVMITVDVITDDRAGGVVVVLAGQVMRRHMHPWHPLEASNPEHAGDRGHPSARAAATR